MIAMAVPATLAVSILPLLLLLLLPSPSVANEGNVLVTGDILPTDGQLSNGGSVFVMQGDCNLVLYSKVRGFQSNTAGRGRDCTLTLSDRGQLIIKDGRGYHIWSSPGGHEQGNYAAVLGPDGVLNVFGPSTWSISAFPSTTADSAVDAQLNNIPLERNLLFSSEVLYGESELTSRDYRLVLTEQCNLEFIKAAAGVVWQSNTNGKGTNCFLRLSHSGVLAVVSDNLVIVWRTPVLLGAPVGNYVLIVGIQGKAAVYGPVVWSAGAEPTGVLAQLRPAEG